MEHDVRIIGVDRPGIGTSTPHLYDNVLDWTGDLSLLADHLGIDTLRIIGLSGGGPYALAAGAAMPERVHGVGVLGGVAPRVGKDAIGGGLPALAPFAAPVIRATRVPLSYFWPRASGSFVRSVDWRWMHTGLCSRAATRSSSPAPSSRRCFWMIC